MQVISRYKQINFKITSYKLVKANHQKKLFLFHQTFASSKLNEVLGLLYEADDEVKQNI